MYVHITGRRNQWYSNAGERCSAVPLSINQIPLESNREISTTGETEVTIWDGSGKKKY